jgi:hypothetical protein
MLDIIAVPAIASLVFSILQVYKKVASKTKREECLLRLIPAIAAAIGVIAGAVCFFAFPDIIAANDVMAAMLVGGASGLSATGCNQIFKQLHKFGVGKKPEGGE